ncbi:urocanate hydratase [Fredinandcohnia onubensis]|uniref:urocanate hydratase n=1 Tax=Fredinandcohnia onubensis TaxID=1571209 RepID=UPI001C558B19|nr:urocanate hydratase [Fredinandcohnia onubensis]
MIEQNIKEKPEILYSVKAQRGDTLRCKGWRQETILRMLENNMENAEKPEELVVYGGIGKAARNWESYHAIVKSLKELEDDETLVVQSGMPVAVFKTHRYAPVVVMATTNIMKPSWETFYELQDKNLTIFAQYTAAPWEYIGTQGVIQGTFETLSAIARKHYNDSLVGKIMLTAGAGGMGGNQTRAMAMHGGVAILADSNIEIIKRRMEVGYIDVLADNLDEAIALAEKHATEGTSIGIAVVGNSADIFEEAYEKGFKPDILTSMTPAHDPISYLPSGYTVQEAEELRKTDRQLYLKKAQETMIRELRVTNKFFDDGVHAFEYGTSLRKECRDGGMPEEEAMKIPGFVAEYIRPLFCEGRGPFRWICMSGDPTDLEKIDNMVLEKFKDDLLVTRWINLAKEHIPIEGLPARICYLGFGQRKEFALEVNRMVKSGELKGPVAFSRDNLDSGSIVNPTFESENMPDGGDLISDWPVLNGLLNAVGMCDLIALQANYSMGEAVHTGVTMIADGTDEADMRLEVCMTVDSGIGVIRHAQAGYQSAKDVANGKGKLTNESIKVPLWWTPTATFGPDDLDK